MQGFVGDIERLTLENINFRQVVYTSKFSQIVLMSLKPLEEIGEEVHDGDQFFRFEHGEGKIVIDGKENAVKNGSAVLVPAGAKHNVINTSSSVSLKLYTIYSPPHHRDGVVHATKEFAASDSEEFDGKTTE